MVSSADSPEAWRMTQPSKAGKESGARRKRSENAKKVAAMFEPIKIRMVSRACEAGDCQSCRHPECECDCHE
jgi:hypothetical protein